MSSHGVKLALGFKAGDDGEGVHGSSRAGDGFQGRPDLLVRREAECLAVDALVPEVRQFLGAVHCPGEYQFSASMIVCESIMLLKLLGVRVPEGSNRGLRFQEAADG